MHGRGARLARALLAGILAGALAAPATAGPQVVVTIKPLHALVARVMAGVGTPQLLVKAGQSAHTYALKPSDVARLHAADIFFRMSETMEPFTTRVAKALPDRVQVVTLEDTPGLRLLERRTGAPFEEAEHAAPGSDHDHTYGHGVIDGHAWLDPDNAKLMADRVAEALSASDPAQAATFAANAGGLKADLDALSAELARALAPVAGKPYIVFHDALQYFELRYGLRPAGSITVSPEVPPSAHRISALRQRLLARGAACVFAEPQFDLRLIEALVEATPVRVGTVDPEGSRIEPGPELYFTLLRNLARDLKTCLVAAG
ncbi:MAG: zinc ABC transporter substrate-binding protein [Hyphomicrobiaceae bacterium]|nr:zinc ABC transporter substrate-binding protein [Hyphomicrobiaceae bacterium]